MSPEEYHGFHQPPHIRHQQLEAIILAVNIEIKINHNNEVNELHLKAMPLDGEHRRLV